MPLLLGILSGLAQPQSGQLKHCKTEHPVVDGWGWFDLSESRDTSLENRGMLLSGQGGRWDARCLGRIEALCSSY